MSYPMLVNSLAKFPQKRDRLLAAIATAEAARAAGSIPNVEYQSAKETINRALETATDYDNAVGWSWTRWNYTRPQLHTIAGIVKKLRTDDPPLLRAFVKEIAPLGELFTALKDMVVKRQPKTTSDDPRDARYVPPPVTTIAAKRVHALLTDLMTASFDELVAALTGKMTRHLDAFKTAVETARSEGKTLTLHHYGQQRGVDLNFLYRVTHDDRPRSMAVLVNDDADQTIQTLAIKEATEVREMFVAKNLRKIVSIMDAKERAGVPLSEVKVVSRDISISGFTGEFHAAFADRSSFDFTNSVVWAENSYGTQFNRFPLRFHNVRLPGGVKMSRPSEERMNTVFIGKVDG